MQPATFRSRKLPGPTEPVDLNVGVSTLETLSSACAEYGSIVAFEDSRRGATVFVNSPEHVGQLLLRQHKKLRKGSDFERVRMLLGNGIIVNDGELWRRHRRALQPAFTRRRIARHVVSMDAVIERLAAEWQRAGAAGVPIDVNTTMSQFGLEIILRAILSDDFDARFANTETNPFRFLSEEFARDLRAVTKLRSARQDVEAVIAERRSSVRRADDFLDELLFGEPAVAAELSLKEIVDEVMTLVVAGYETSAATLTFAWNELAQRPALAERLVAEFDAAEPMADQPLEWMAELPLMRSVLHETLRLYPPVWLFSRASGEFVEVLDLALPAQTTIMLSPYLLHRHDDYWRSADEFQPERFLKSVDQPAYMPFSLGPRRCIGEYFSQLEMCRHFRVLLRAFVPDRADATVADLAFGINLRPGHKVSLTLTPRTESTP
ncbi:MAG: cytochrome P450 [Pseudomonadota bacterium]